MALDRGGVAVGRVDETLSSDQRLATAENIVRWRGREDQLLGQRTEVFGNHECIEEERDQQLSFSESCGHI